MLVHSGAPRPCRSHEMSRREPQMIGRAGRPRKRHRCGTCSPESCSPALTGNAPADKGFRAFRNSDAVNTEIVIVAIGELGNTRANGPTQEGQSMTSHGSRRTPTAWSSDPHYGRLLTEIEGRALNRVDLARRDEPGIDRGVSADGRLDLVPKHIARTLHESDD